MDRQNLTHAGTVVVRDIAGTPEFLIISALAQPQEAVLPKGHIKPGETPETAALRELREEAGIEGEILAPLGIHEFDAPGEHVRAAFYLVDFRRRISAEEARRYRWCGYEEALRQLSHDDAQHLIEEARVTWLEHQRKASGHADN